MTEDPIADDVRQFILENVDSVAHLEALLLLYHNPETGLSIDEIAGRLYIDRQQAEEILTRLSELGLLSITQKGVTSCRYQPESAELKSQVERLAETYSKYLIPVTNLIHSKPKTRVQEFADAFKLKRRKK